MEIKNISLHELRKMNYSEGLVIQGCGGDWTIVNKVDRRREKIKKELQIEQEIKGD